MSKAIIFLIIVATSFSVTTVFADTTLPNDSAELLEKLDAFIAEEQGRVDAVIAEKKSAVLNLLKKHLERETQAGNLEKAVTLKKKIEEFSTGDRQDDDSSSEGGKSGEITIPSDAVERSGHYYKVFEVPPKGWQLAQSKCEELGGHLAIINTASELRFIARLAKDYNHVWLGASGDSTGWKWVDGSEFKEGRELKKGEFSGLLLRPDSLAYDFHALDGHFINAFVCEWSD